MDHVIQSGLMTRKELEISDTIKAPGVKWQLPIQWTQQMLRAVFDERSVPAPIAAAIVKELGEFRDKFRQLYCYDWVGC